MIGARSGGVSLYNKSNLVCSGICELTCACSNVECLLVKCRNYIIAIVYRLPSGSPSVFLEFLKAIFQYSSGCKLPVILLGDFNINLTLSESWQLEFLDVVQSCGFEYIIDRPARVMSDTETLLDLCITNEMTNDIASGVMTLDLSDHLVLFCSVPCKNKSSNKTNISSPYYRDISDYNIECFAALVWNINWSDIYNEPSSSKLYVKSSEKTKSAYEESFPFRKAIKA
ncbi:uncharacterized protein LOC120842937 [Ixodes scapularis]|uniref:uncharacterized protein LOC120842937 n=1 Tax=Ixodes scapularis TaxID=6945 RepID=UPI001A9ED6F0|nr:uncharacterized protein LOC120842937 [Ixodes scapularis]